MTSIARLAAALAAVVNLSFAASAADVPGSKDPPGFKRFQGSEIVGYNTRSFDEYILARGPGAPGGDGFAKFEKIEGGITRVVYKVPAGHTSLELLRNYQQMVQAAGFTQDFELKTMAWDGYFYDKFVDQTHSHSDNHYLKQARNPMYFTAKSVKGAETRTVAVLVVESGAMWWPVGGNSKEKVVVKDGDILVSVDVVTSKSVGNSMVELKADDMAKAIAATGKVDIYGIYFDVDKSAIKPESAPTLEQVAQLMKNDPSLKLIVAGHTDNTGAAKHNMELSEGRAAAVVKALTTNYGVTATRLQPKGFGDTQPVAPNTSEEERARNRRVELRKA